MTSTRFNVGWNGDDRNSSRVLKPPGGGSSDIFGGNNESLAAESRARARANAIQQSSTLFLGDDDTGSVTGAKSQKPGNDSYQRLFGEVEIPTTPAKNYMKSNIVLDVSEVDSSASAKSIDTNGNQSIPSMGSTPDNGNSPRDGNPVTGEGYDNPIKPSTPVVNGTGSTAPPTPTSSAAPRQRVPPGGYSSGLW